MRQDHGAGRRVSVGRAGVGRRRTAAAVAATAAVAVAGAWGSHPARATTYTVAASGALTSPATYNTAAGATAFPVNGDSVLDALSLSLTYGATDYNGGSGLTSLATLSLTGASKVGTFTQSAGNLSIGTFNLSSASGSTSNYAFLMQGGVSNIGTLTVGTGLSAGINESGGTINLAGSLSYGSLGNGTQSVAVTAATFNVSGTSIVLGNRANTNVFPNASLVVSGGGVFNSLNAASVVNLGNAGIGTGGPTGAVGVLNVSSGTFNDNGASAAVNLGTAAAGIGSILVTNGGTFNQTGPSAGFNLAKAANATGTLNVSGGTYNFGGTQMFVGNAGAANASGSVLVVGTGVLSAPSAVMALGQFGAANASAGAITTGSLTIADAGSVTVAGLLLGGANATSYVNGIVNLNGGTLTTGGINLGATSATAGPNTLAFNANGGTVVASFNSSTNSSFFSGLQVNLQAGGLTFDTGANAVAFATGLSGVGGLTKAGVGTLSLGSASAYAGGTNVSAGTLVAASNSAVGAGPVTVGAGAQLSVAAPTGRTVLAINGLTLAGTAGAYTGRVDVAGNALDLPGASLSDATAMAAQGFAGGAWNGSGGIVSSAAAADAAHLTAVGVIQNNGSTGSPLFGDGTTAPLFDQAAVGASDVLVKFTYYGDTNLDGVVNAADYTRVDAGFVSGLTGWANGDVNYDGVVDGSDYALIDNAFNQQATVLAQSLVAAPAAAFATASAVPEPATVGVLVIGLAGALGRRRRRA